MIPEWVHPVLKRPMKDLLADVMKAKPADEPPMARVIPFPATSGIHKPPIAAYPQYRPTATHWAFSAQGAGAEGQPPNLGALFSQSPVTVNQETGRLAVVNAGSNTIQLYNIDPADPTQLTPIGEAVPSGGDFPQSLVFNNNGDKLCVLNGGLDSNVQ